MNRLLLLAASLILIAGMAALAQQPNSIQTAQRKSSERVASSITGRVLGDTGQPLSQVTIHVFGVGGVGRGNRTTATDQDGNFSMDELAPGAYRVFARAPGYITESEFQETPYYRPGDSAIIRLMKGGVITGQVTNFAGEPIITAPVHAIRVRDLEGRSVSIMGPVNRRFTDDRGIYRLYGLTPGIYLVQVGGGYGPTTAYDTDAPTYFPSSARDVAGEITVQAGDEVTGIDIRYRGESGYAISGAISGTTGASGNFTGTSLSLNHATTGAAIAFTFITTRNEDAAFAFYGVPDGEYEVTAQAANANENGAASSPRRVVVRGADVTGLELKLAPLSSVSGRISLELLEETEGKDECKDNRRAALEETLVIARSDDKDRRKNEAPSRAEDAPDDKGDFRLRNLKPGRYHLLPDLSSKNWYIRAITSPSSARGNRAVDAARNGIALKSGERVEGISLAIAEGAASLTGQVVHSVEGSRLPDRLRVHLVPADKGRADDTLRFAEAQVKTDGSFVMDQLAPGRYRLVVRQASEEESSGTFQRPMAWDAEGRETLRRMAESVDAIIELQTCRQVSDHKLVYTPGPATDVRPPKKRKQVSRQAVNVYSPTLKKSGSFQQATFG